MKIKCLIGAVVIWAAALVPLACGGHRCAEECGFYVVKIDASCGRYEAELIQAFRDGHEVGFEGNGNAKFYLHYGENKIKVKWHWGMWNNSESRTIFVTKDTTMGFCNE